MEKLSLIDASPEDDLLISSSDCSTLEPANANEEENQLKMSKQCECIPEISKSPEQKRVKPGKVNLRKSLAWDSAFFTSEGVLNTEELAIVNSTFRKTEACSLPGIQEELRRSAESTSTLDSESYTLESLEGDLFNLRASIQMSLAQHGNSSSGERDASRLGSRKKSELPSQTKTKPAIALKRDSVSERQLECVSNEAVIGGEKAMRGSGNSKLLLKPPRIVPKPTTLPTVPSNNDSSGSSQMKNNARRTSAGSAANRQGMVTLNKTSGDSNSMTSRSTSLPKPNPLHPGTMVFPSKNSPTSNSPHSVISPLENSSKRNALRGSDKSLPGRATRTTPIRTSKSKFGLSNSKLSSKASPSSSIDSFVSEGSSSTSSSVRPSNSVESMSSTISSSPSMVSIEQASIKKDIASGHLQSQPTAKASLGARIFPEPSNKDHATRSSITSNTGAKSIKPSGLRMPSPKIGYFDAEKTLVNKKPNNFSQIGLGISVKSNIGMNDNVGASKLKSSRIPSIRPAAHAQSAPPPLQTMSPASPAQVHTNSSLAYVQATRQSESEKHGELAHGANSEVKLMTNKLNSVSDKILKENMLPAYETNGLIRHSPSEAQKPSAVAVMGRMMSSFSLSETTELVVGD